VENVSVEFLAEQKVFVNHIIANTFFYQVELAVLPHKRTNCRNVQVPLNNP